jgi:acyl carrier protein phosphodiesterase
MNFLAHLYLSGDDEATRVGNFIGDFVRGRDLAEKYGAGVARGVELHRAIDEFTDKHPVVKQSKTRLWTGYRHYSAVIVDIYYDHFLAAGWKKYSDEPLHQYAQGAYDLMNRYQPILPEQFKMMLSYMTRGNWLVNYAQVEGIGRALTGLSRRTTFESRMEESVKDLRQHYAEFQAEFDTFFPELKRFSELWRKQH